LRDKFIKAAFLIITLLLIYEGENYRENWAQEQRKRLPAIHAATAGYLFILFMLVLAGHSVSDHEFYCTGWIFSVFIFR